MPSSPTTLSVVTLWPRRSPSLGATMCATTSAGPPGGNGTTMRIARSGKAAEPTCPQTPTKISAKHSRISTLMILPPRSAVSLAPGRRRRNTASKGEGVEAAVGADIEPIVGGQQILEMEQPRHRIFGPAAGKQRLAGVAAIAVQPIVSFGAEDPDDRVRAAVGRRDD